MLEQMGDVVRKAEPATIIRFRRHTWKSRVASILLISIAVAYFAWVEFRRQQGQAHPFTFPLALVLIVGQRLVRRWQTEVIRPRPQSQEDRKAYRYLQITGVVASLICIAPFFLFVWDPVDSPWHLLLAVAMAAGFAALYVGSWILRAAYDRLFARIAATEGAYGF